MEGREVISKLTLRLQPLVESNDDLSEIIVDSDGKVFMELSGKLVDTSVVFERAELTVLINSMAARNDLIVNQDNPTLSVKFPFFHGGRFHAQIPPVVSSPIFAIRIPPRRVFSLDDLHRNDTVRYTDYKKLLKAVILKKNIVIAGGTSSGKTSIANAIIKTILDGDPSERLIISEDNPELITNSSLCVHFLTNSRFSHRDAVINSLRLRPDRIIIGEVRDGESAIELCKAWLTGHPGGITTIHATSADSVYKRFYSLFQEVVTSPDRTLIESAVEVVVFCKKILLPSGDVARRVIEIRDV